MRCPFCGFDDTLSTGQMNVQGIFVRAAFNF